MEEHAHVVLRTTKIVNMNVNNVVTANIKFLQAITLIVVFIVVHSVLILINKARLVLYMLIVCVCSVVLELTNAIL